MYFLVRRRIDEKERHLTSIEIPELEELLAAAIKVFENIKEGHSYQSLTGNCQYLSNADQLRAELIFEEIKTLKLCLESTYFN